MVAVAFANETTTFLDIEKKLKLDVSYITPYMKHYSRYVIHVIHETLRFACTGYFGIIQYRSMIDGLFSAFLNIWGYTDQGL